LTTLNLKKYQKDAIDELLSKATKILDHEGTQKVVALKAPTGSGKTIMMAEFLRQLIDMRRDELGFIWTAPRQLHIQSHSKLEAYFQGTRALECSFFEDLSDGKIQPNEILFFNWESINKEDNIYIRDNEQDLNLSNVLERTRNEGTKIILIIDEAHHHATSAISQGLIQMIDPKLTIEVSATPVNPTAENVVVYLEDVKAEGMIKNALILNENFANIIKEKKIASELSDKSEAWVIDASLKKRENLLDAYNKEGRKVKPLVLIQLPDQIGELERGVKDTVIQILKDKYDISTENGKLAIWLSGEHVNKEEVEKPDSEVEVLIFKQAIALGWDCPRAQILALFRQWHSQIFSIQTVGRIMRMPEPELGHYKNDVLNYGYIYTNLGDITIHEDVPTNYIKVFHSRRRNDYTSIDLLSCYGTRLQEKTRLSPLFIKIFLKHAEKHGLKDEIDLREQKIDEKIFSDWRAEDIDALLGKKIEATENVEMGELELKKLFDFFIRDRLRAGPVSLYPEDRSVGRLKEAIYVFFEDEFKRKRGESEDDTIRIVLSDKNVQYINAVIDMAKTEYQETVTKREAKLEPVECWNVPESLRFGEDDVEEKAPLSIMQPFYRTSPIRQWKTESQFIKFLKKSQNVEWWFKNGERDATFFAVPYAQGNKQLPFYVDFIVKFKDGKVGLFDTKAGRELETDETKEKIDGLYEYIQNENLKGENLFGGIVTNTDQRKYRGRWIYFDKTRKDLKQKNFGNWQNFPF